MLEGVATFVAIISVFRAVAILVSPFVPGSSRQLHGSVHTFTACLMFGMQLSVFGHRDSPCQPLCSKRPASTKILQYLSTVLYWVLHGVRWFCEVPVFVLEAQNHEMCM